MSERRDRIRAALRERGWDLLVCALPKNVLMLTGYWPIIGTGVACADADGAVHLLVPVDEKELAENSSADRVSTFQAGSLETLAPAARLIEQPLRKLINGHPSRIGYESGEVSEPSSYVSMNLYNCALAGILNHVAPNARLDPADDALAELRAIKTEPEIERIRAACQTAGTAFAIGFEQMQAGMQEVQAARHFRRPLGCSAAERADGQVSCMSGANSGTAYGAFARSTHRCITPGDLVLTHCNSYEDGYWTDITRTYVIGEPDDRQLRMFDAIRAAREAAISAIAPGVPAADVDHAARERLAELGFGAEFKHSTGHGVGFGGIDAHARPRLHPKSPDRLETGMVFNVEPGIYFPGSGGMRQCDMVALTAQGTELLTPFQSEFQVVS